MQQETVVKGFTEITPLRERAILVGLDLPENSRSMHSTLAELERLADTAGADTVDKVIQKLKAPVAATYIGTGKAQEIASLASMYKLDLVIFDDELSPSQQSNLEKIMGKNVKVIDRTALILDIFALHATSKEGALQVRLAQNQYLYPRLRGMWAHLASNRMGGGVGSRFGEGESQLEVDRRIVRKRIESIKAELKHLEGIRRLQRLNRYDSDVFKIALAGYTNSGKSSLLNTLTDAGVLSYDQLFATLDSTTRKYILPEGRETTLTDTVGFIQKLPTTLIEAFKSTLDEILGSDLILHVIDSSSEELMQQIHTDEETLQQIKAQNIPQIMVFNKVDLLNEEQRLALGKRYPDSVMISAKTKEGIDDLVKRLVMASAALDTYMEVVIPYDKGHICSQIHQSCKITQEWHDEKGTHFMMHVPARLVSKFENYRK
ncbi:MAG: GTPase HflX [Eggerthellaceae bacterium]|nr:GTPase HflX [Eggerthellaceae bacterium]